MSGDDVLWRGEGVTPTPPEPLPARADLVIVGGGLVGVSVALSAARQGATPLLLERDTIASGASGRNDGQLLLEAAEFYSRLVESRGRAVARELLEFKCRSQRELESFLSDQGRLEEVEWIRRGSYFLASTDAEERELHASVDLLLEDGFPVAWHDASTVADRVGTDRFRGGLYAAEDALVQPYALTRALAEEARAAGADIREGTPVERLHGNRLVTPHGECEAEVVVLATNAWTGALLGRDDWIWPIRGQILSTDPVEPFLDVGCSTNFGYEYWRQAQDGRLVAGGFRWTDEEGERGTELGLHDAIQTRIEGFLRELYSPRFPELRVTSRWSGTMGFSIDGLPLVGPVPGRPTVWLAAGFTGYGMSIGYGVGECIAERLLQGETAYSDGPLSTSRLVP